MVATLGQSVSGLVQVTQALETQAALQLAGLNVTTPAGNTLRAVTLFVNDLSNKSAVLAGTATGVWTVDSARLAAHGIADPSKIIRVFGALISPVTNASVVGTAVSLPGTQSELGFTPAGSSTQATAQFVLTNAPAVVQPAALGSPTSPLGAWSLTLPAALPLGTTTTAGVTNVLLSVLLEVQP